MSLIAFFESVETKLCDLAEATGARITTPDLANVAVRSARPVEASEAGSITFVDNAKYLGHVETTQATAIICHEKHVDAVPDGVAVLVHDKPYEAYGACLRILYPTANRPLLVMGEEGISKRAVVGEDCQIEEGVTIEAGAVVGNNVSIGRGSHIHANAIVASGCQIGRDTTIGAGASVAHALIGDQVILHPGVRVGSDGFGFAMGPGGHKKLPQIGRVIIQDKVEIGSNSTVDRGANRDTVIGEGTKIDNLVQIGHNVVIGMHCVIVGLAGVSGSATLGNYVVVAGQAGIVGHISIGDGAQVGGGSGVHSSVGPGERVMGYPAIPARLWMRDAAKQMLDAKKRVKKKDGDKT